MDHNLEPLPYFGSRSTFYRAGPGEIIKTPMQISCGSIAYREKRERENREALHIERLILTRLGTHPRIVPFLGEHAGPPTGLVLAEASRGNLQTYIDSGVPISALQRWRFSAQLAEAVVYIHSKGVIHSDMRPENVLVHQPQQDPMERLSLWLSDFGGSSCAALHLDGGHLPDFPFADPRHPPTSSAATDIFSLGSIFYVLATGAWPLREDTKGAPRWETAEEMWAYVDRVQAAFGRGEFPPVEFEGGYVLRRCWEGGYKTAEEVLRDVRCQCSALELMQGPQESDDDPIIARTPAVPAQ